MKRSRFSEEQIITILKQAEGGLTVPELIRQHGISEGTYYRWKSKYGGMELGDAKRLKQIEAGKRGGGNSTAPLSSIRSGDSLYPFSISLPAA